MYEQNEGTKNLGGEIKQIAHFMPSNFYKFEKHEMTTFNIPPPGQTNIQEISPPVKFFFKEKIRARQADYSLIWLKLLLAENMGGNGPQKRCFRL
ncbi:MAG: hypothetical protein ACREOI_19540 [bacterium]